MPIFGTLAGLTAAGLYAVVDEIRVSHKVRSHQISGRLQAWDYKVNDDRFNGIIRRFENDWELDGGSLYPEKLIGFFAENPDARKQWVRMQASIILHNSGCRLMQETDVFQFGNESIQYDINFGGAERKYIFEHDKKAANAILIAEAEQKKYNDHINRVGKIKDISKIVLIVLGFFLMIAGVCIVKPVILSALPQWLIWLPVVLGILLWVIAWIIHASDPWNW